MTSMPKHKETNVKEKFKDTTGGMEGEKKLE